MWLCLAVVLLLASPSCAEAKPAPPIAAVVETAQGALQGSCVGGSCVFKGIPYAEPPVSDLRWRPPVHPPEAWNGTRDATDWGANCPQLTLTGVVAGEESCLFVNVFAPEACFGGGGGGSKCAVMFWIHGGAYTAGGTAPPIGAQFNGSNFNALADDVVVVTANYRLGILGFAGAEALRARDTAGGGSTGNYGIQDQRAALRWAQANIGAFGGDAGNVMIFGESAGAGSVAMHLTMPRSFGGGSSGSGSGGSSGSSSSSAPLYHKVGMESGAFAYWNAQPMAEAEQQFADLRAATGCGAGGDGIACLLALDSGNLTAVATAGLPKHFPRPYGCPFAPTVDGVELAALPWDLRDAGRFNKDVPVLLGFNRDEGTIGIAADPFFRAEGAAHFSRANFSATLREQGLDAEQVRAALAAYAVPGGSGDADYSTPYWAATHFAGDYGFSCPTRRSTAALQAFQAPGQKVFLYYFNHVPLAPPFSWAGIPGENGTAGCSHASELAFVWQVAEADGSAQHLMSDGERLLGRTMASYWSNFAKSSDPNVGGYRTSMTVAWPPHDAATGNSSIELRLPALATAQNRLHAQCELLDTFGVLQYVPAAGVPPASTAFPDLRMQ